MGRNSRRQPTRFRVGEVSYYQHHNAWYLYYRDGGRPVRQRIGTSKDEAAAAAAQVNAQLAAALPTFFSFKPILVDDLIRLYLDYHEYTARSAIGTIDRYRTALRHFQAYLKSTGRARLAHEVDVDGLVRHLRGLKVSPNGHSNSRKRPLRDKGARFVLETCRSLYSFARKRRHLPPYTDNPFSEVTSKRLRIEDAKPIFIFDEKTEFSFLQAADGWEFAAHFLMAKTGMRPGEVNHLLIEEADLEAGWLHIRNKPELCWQVKTREERNVPLCDALKAVLVKQIGGRKAGPVFVRPDFQVTDGEPPTRRQMQRQLERRVAVAERERDTAVSREERAALATAVWREAGALKHDDVRRSFLRIANRAGLPDLTCPKCWRHTFATLLQEANVDPLIRQLTLGHKPPRNGFGPLGMTTVYTHTSPATQHREICRAVALWPRSLELAFQWCQGGAS